jgi:hypothetical protein
VVVVVVVGGGLGGGEAGVLHQRPRAWWAGAQQQLAFSFCFGVRSPCRTTASTQRSSSRVARSSVRVASSRSAGDRSHMLDSSCDKCDECDMCECVSAGHGGWG